MITLFIIEHINIIQTKVSSTYHDFTTTNSSSISMLHKQKYPQHTITLPPQTHRAYQCYTNKSILNTPWLYHHNLIEHINVIQTKVSSTYHDFTTTTSSSISKLYKQKYPQHIWQTHRIYQCYTDKIIINIPGLYHHKLGENPSKKPGTACPLTCLSSNQYTHRHTAV